jgi:hypothetical protein
MLTRTYADPQADPCLVFLRTWNQLRTHLSHLHPTSTLSGTSFWSIEETMAWFLPDVYCKHWFSGPYPETLYCLERPRWLKLKGHAVTPHSRMRKAPCLNVFWHLRPYYPIALRNIAARMQRRTPGWSNKTLFSHRIFDRYSCWGASRSFSSSRSPFMLQFDSWIIIKRLPYSTFFRRLRLSHMILNLDLSRSFKVTS